VLPVGIGDGTEYIATPTLFSCRQLQNSPAQKMPIKVR